MAREPYECPLCGAKTFHPEDIRQGYCPNCHALTREPAMTTWSIFDRPEDYPTRVVVRGFDIFNGMTEPVPQRTAYLFNDVETASAWVRQEHPECVRFVRAENDPPYLVESWV